MARLPAQLPLPGQELQTRTSDRTRGSAPLHTALQAGGKGTHKPPAIALSGSPYHVLPTGPGSMAFPFQLPPPPLPLGVPLNPRLDSEQDAEFPGFLPSFFPIPLAGPQAILLLQMPTGE